MAIDKSRSPVWVKITVWVLVVALIVGFVAIGFSSALPQIGQLFGFGSGTTTPGGNVTSADTLDVINARYNTQATSTEAAVSADPDNLALRKQMGILYSNWAGDLAASSDPAAQAQFAATMAKALPHWQKAYELAPDDKAVAGDLASSMFYAGQTDEGIALAREVVAKNPDYTTVWYNLANFLASTGDTEGAKEAFAKVIEVATAAEQDMKGAAQAALDSLTQ